jgi:hypothetical protein
MIWDFCPDMMHVVKTFFDRLVLGVFSGKRKPTYKFTKPKKPARDADAAERKKYKDARRKYKACKKEYKDERKRFDECLFDNDAQKLVDERVQNLVGYPYWIRNTLVTHMLNFLGFFNNSWDFSSLYPRI